MEDFIFHTRVSRIFCIHHWTLEIYRVLRKISDDDRLEIRHVSISSMFLLSCVRDFIAPLSHALQSNRYQKNPSTIQLACHLIRASLDVEQLIQGDMIILRWRSFELKYKSDDGNELN